MKYSIVGRRFFSNGFMSSWRVSQFGMDEELMSLHAKSKLPTITRSNEILVKIRAASLNPIDLRMKEGYGRNIIALMRRIDQGTLISHEATPIVLGRDCSGVVVDVGMNVKKFKAGDEVWCTLGAEKQGCFAQYTVATENLVSLKPKSLSHIEAASFPYVACTVWTALCTIARMQNFGRKGLSVLIHAGSGGIGTFAIQLAKVYNARVTTTCKSDAHPLVKKLGADSAVDYSSPRAFDELAACGPFDVILDPVNTELSQKSISLLGLWRGSVCVNICNPLLQNTDQFGMGEGLIKSVVEFSSQFVRHAADGRISVWGYVKPDGRTLDVIGDFVETGKIKPVIDEVFPFDDLPRAVKKLSDGCVRGKLVIQM